RPSATCDEVRPSTATPSATSRTSPTSWPTTGAIPTPESGKCGWSRNTSPSLRRCAGWRSIEPRGSPRLGTCPSVAGWLAEAAASGAFIDTRCWSARLGSYVRYAGSEELDVSLLLMPIIRYDEPRSPRLAGTIEAVRRELGRGALVYRYTGEDGLAGVEGVFA